MLIFMTVLAILGWLQAIRISRRADAIARKAQWDLYRAEQRNIQLDLLLQAAKHWQSYNE